MVLHSFQADTDQLLCVALSPDKTTVALGDIQGVIYLYDISTGERLRLIGKYILLVTHSLVFTKDGQGLISYAEDPSVRLWEVASGRLLKTYDEWAYGENERIPRLARGMLRPDEYPDGSPGPDPWASYHSGTVSHDETLVAAGGGGRPPKGQRFGHLPGIIKIWDFTTEQEIQVLQGGMKDVGSVAFSPDGTLLANTSMDRTVHVWETASWQRVTILTGFTEHPTSVAFSPDNTYFAVGAESTKIFNTADWSEARVLTNQNDVVVRVAFSPDGSLLAAGGRGKQVVLYDTTTWQVGHTILDFPATIMGIVFSSDSKMVVAASGDGFVQIGNLSRS